MQNSIWMLGVLEKRSHLFSARAAVRTRTALVVRIDEVTCAATGDSKSRKET